MYSALTVLPHGPFQTVFQPFSSGGTPLFSMSMKMYRKPRTSPPTSAMACRACRAPQALASATDPL